MDSSVACGEGVSCTVARVAWRVSSLRQGYKGLTCLGDQVRCSKGMQVQLSVSRESRPSYSPTRSG
jgi:hypothetical protein